MIASLFLLLTITVPWGSLRVDRLTEALSGWLDRPMTLELVVLPVTRSGGSGRHKSSQ